MDELILPKNSLHFKDDKKSKSQKNTKSICNNPWFSEKEYVTLKMQNRVDSITKIIMEEKIMKKFLAMTLALVMVFALCSGGMAYAANTTITLMASQDWIEDAEQDLVAFPEPQSLSYRNGYGDLPLARDLCDLHDKASLLSLLP